MLRVSYYGSMKHDNQHGALCHGPGCSTCLPAHAVEPGISDQCKSLVRQLLVQNPKATHVEIIKGMHAVVLSLSNVCMYVYALTKRGRTLLPCFKIREC